MEVGWRFMPTDEELVVHFLDRKIKGLPSYAPGYVLERDLYDKPPWDLFDDHSDPWQTTKLKDRTERNIYVITQLRKASLRRNSRVVGCGAWHSDVGPREIFDDNGETIGFKRTYCFEVTTEFNINGIRGHWIMHEYRSTTRSSMGGSEEGSNYVICKISRDDSKPLKAAPEKRRLKNKNINDKKALASSKRARPSSSHQTSNAMQKEKKLKRNHKQAQDIHNNEDTNEDLDVFAEQLLEECDWVEEVEGAPSEENTNNNVLSGFQLQCHDPESFSGSNNSSSVFMSTSEDDDSNQFLNELDLSFEIQELTKHQQEEQEGTMIQDDLLNVDNLDQLPCDISFFEC